MADIDFEKFLRDEAARTGASYEPDDLRQLQGKNPEDVGAHMQALSAQYEKRGAPTGHRTSDSQSPQYASDTGNNRAGLDPRTEPNFRETRNLGPSLYSRYLTGQQTPAAQPAASTYQVPGWDQAAYQQYQQNNPGAPLSPFEFMLGRQWTDADDSALARGEMPAGVTPQAVQLYESQGAQWPGPRPSAPQASTPTQPTAPVTGGASAGGTNTNPQFTNPSQRLIEDYALDRFRQRTNPDPQSGTAIFEQYARELIDTLKQPYYSPQEEAAIKGSAIGSIEQERSATKQRWMEELSRRGITPSSGIALEGLLKIDEYFNQARNVFEREFAIHAIQGTKQQRFQTLDTAGQLAGSEEGRLREALTYASLPYQLEQDAFQRNLQLTGAAGAPSQLFNSALALAQLGMQQDAYRSQNRAQLTEGLLQLIGYGWRG